MAFLRLPENRVLVSAKHDEHPLAGIRLKDQGFDSLPLREILARSQHSPRLSPFQQENFSPYME